MMLLEKPHVFVTQLFLVVLSLKLLYVYVHYHVSDTDYITTVLHVLFIRVNECIGMGNLHKRTKTF